MNSPIDTRIAISCRGERIAPVFDSSKEIWIFDIRSAEASDIGRDIMPSGSSAQRAIYLILNGIDVLVCGALSIDIYNTLIGCGLTLVPFRKGMVEDVVKAWIRGDILAPSFTMPGCNNNEWIEPLKMEFQDNISEVKRRVKMPRGTMGRGKGSCAGQGQRGADWSVRRGRADGLCQMLYGDVASGVTDLQKQALKNRAEALQAELDLIKNRLSEMEAAKTA